MKFKYKRYSPEIIRPVTVGGWSYDIKAGFLPNIARLGHGVVGQAGFFENFIVKFDHAKEEIELKPRAK